MEETRPLKPPLQDTFAAVRAALEAARGAAVRHDGTEQALLDQRAHVTGHRTGERVAVQVEILEILQHAEAVRYPSREVV